MRPVIPPSHLVLFWGVVLVECLVSLALLAFVVAELRAIWRGR